MNRRKKVFSLLILLFLVVGIPISVFLALQQQDIRQRASVSEGQATVSLSPTSGSFAVGESIPVTVSFNTGGAAISAIAIRITYTSPEVTVDPASIQISAASGFSTGNCPVKTVATEGSQVKIDLACVDISAAGNTTTTNTPLATFTLVAGSIPATNPVVLTFDPIQSIMTKKADAQDTLLTPTSTGSYTIAQAQNPTATPTPTQTATNPTATPTPISTQPTPTRTPTPTQAASNNPTPTPTQAPTSSPTTAPAAPTATPIASATLPTPTPTTAILAMALTNIRTGQTIQNRRPTFTGKAPAGSRIDIVLESDPVTATITADASGTWSWTPPQDMQPGQHKLTITATDTQNRVTTTVAQFTVAGAQQIPVTATSTPTIVIGTFGLLLLVLGVLFTF